MHQVEEYLQKPSTHAHLSCQKFLCQIINPVPVFLFSCTSFEVGASQLVQAWERSDSPGTTFWLLVILPTFWSDALAFFRVKMKMASASDQIVWHPFHLQLLLKIIDLTDNFKNQIGFRGPTSRGWRVRAFSHMYICMHIHTYTNACMHAW